MVSAFENLNQSEDAVVGEKGDSIRMKDRARSWSTMIYFEWPQDSVPFYEYFMAC